MFDAMRRPSSVDTLPSGPGWRCDESHPTGPPSGRWPWGVKLGNRRIAFFPDDAFGCILMHRNYIVFGMSTAAERW